ncbi:glycosyltransferase [Ruminiclostridium cellulolyticum]|uniref:Glycosyl transferase family 2 n=1 Tax=Ruminiclostridium cellulolyticum (strain ATCC 35319 / DSM 5812 / JCM 6584 / H10) TaxID=394503 RepID=B8I320_RUMCH|nr:glycosyltransferase [Ruminiclostridium cellulolyticum]ACL76163.1 glycosyl transferase family 2 [Ruminiclostridium cellulolyticum H10]
MKKASIVIPTKDKISRLRLVLKALEGQVDDTVEVIIVFDGCNKETLKNFEGIRLSYTPIKVIHEQNVGRAKARNSGILKASGNVLIFLDDDRIPSPNFVYKHIKAHEKGRYAIVGERSDVNYPEEKLDEFYRNGLTDSDYSRIKKDSVSERFNYLKKTARIFLGQYIECVTFSTGNSSVQRQDLLNVGMFDENFTGWGLEDTDLGYRLYKSGVKIKRNYSIVNYHLVHPVNNIQQNNENRRNFYYFISKIEGDKAAIRMTKLLHRIIYKQRF